MINVTFVTGGNKTVAAEPGANLLHISVRGQGGLPFKCGGGACGTCRCTIEQGIENCEPIRPKERRHLTEEEFAKGMRMACQTFLKGDVSVSWVPLAQRKPAPAARPAATSCATWPSDRSDRRDLSPARAPESRPSEVACSGLSRKISSAIAASSAESLGSPTGAA